MTYQIIDENEDNKNFNINNITTESLGLKPTNDFAQFANQRIVDEEPEKAAAWKSKGGIGVMEAGKMFADEFEGSYDNVMSYDMQRNNLKLNHPNLDKRSKTVDERIERNRIKQLERNKRVNEGTASFGDRVGAFLDRIGNNIYNEQINQADTQDKMYRPHLGDKNYKYKPAETSLTGYVRYDEVDLRKKIGFTEGLVNSLESGAALPFVGGWLGGQHKKNMVKIADKINNGEQITQQELDAFNRYRLKEYEKQIRGYSIGGQIGESWLPSMLAFGTEMALGGAVLKGIGLAGKGIKLGSAIGEGLSKIPNIGKAGQKIAKGIGWSTGELSEAGLSTAIGGTISNIADGNFFSTYNERRLNDKVKITDKGTVVFTQAKEAPATAFLKSMLQCYISYFTEYTGGLIGGALIKPVGKAIGFAAVNPLTKKAASVGAKQFARVLEHCPKMQGFLEQSATLLSKAYEKMNGLPVIGKNTDWLKSTVRFDGFLEELGEEVAEDVLDLTLGVNNEERSLDNYRKAIFKSADEWAVLAGTIALQGTAISAAGNLLGSAMQKKGIAPEDIAQVLTTSTEAEKGELIDGLIKENTIKIRNITPAQRLRQKEIKEQIKNQLTDIGIDEKEADNLSILTGAMYERYGTQDEKSKEIFDRYINNLSIKYNIPAQQGVKALHQSAMLADINPEQKVNVIDLSKEFDTDKNLSKKELTEYIKSLINSNPLTSGDKKALFSFVARSKRVGKPNVYIPAHIAGSSKVETNYKGERNTAVNNIINLIQNSTLIDVSENRDKKTKPDVDTYLRFYTPVRIGNNVYTVRITAENNKNKNVFNILNADVYDVIIDKKMTTSSTLKNNSSNSLMKSSDNIINDNAENINPDEQIAIKDMLKDVKDSGGKTYFQLVYHGTPHRFDELSTEHIGEGEGNQAHGWGLYFARNKEVSENYRRKLSGDKVFYNGEEIKQSYVYTHKYMNGEDVEQNKYLSYLRSVIDDIGEIQADKKITTEEARQQFIKDYESKNKLLAFQKKYLEIAKNIDTSKIDIQKGQLFKVDIPEDDVMLDEDKSLSEQPEKVRKAIFEYMENNPDDFILPKDHNSLGNMTGKQFYKEVSLIERKKGSEGNGQKEASLTLNSYGIKGIKYNGQQDGECYVVFDDKAINILQTYYQMADDNSGAEKRIAGYTYNEVLGKIEDINKELYNNKANLPKSKEKNLMSKIHVLEKAFDAAEFPDKYANPKQYNDIMLNAAYVMNDEELPKDFIETDSESQQTFNDLRELHNRKKEQKQALYLGYFEKDSEYKPVITIMKIHDKSTALHEFGHLFLDMLNELAKVNDDAKEQLETVNKWLGSDGYSYTRQQHEKFANNFVAYLYKGKTPNSRLKRVFENFKEWLKSVYQHVIDIPNADISPEVQEMFDNIFGADIDYNEVKEVNELLQKVKSLTTKRKTKKNQTDNELTEGQKRCKDVAYDILSAATGKSTTYLKTIFETTSNKKSFGKKRENIEELLDKADGRITSTGGLNAAGRENWKEFFADTGVNYDSEEVGADEELTRKALDTIENKSYWDLGSIEYEVNSELDNRAEYYERIINDADRQYSALLSSYKHGNRNVALAAIYEWIDGLDKEIKDDYENKFIYDLGIIERNENIDKFDKAKRQILQKAMELDNQLSINENEKYQELVKEVVKNLNFLQPYDKAKLTANILDIKSTGFLMAQLDDIMDIAKTMEDETLRRNLERDIHKELQSTKNVKKNGRTVGKYNYKNNKIFEKLRKLDRLSSEKADEIRLEESKFANAEDNGISKENKLINMFLSYKAGGRTYTDTDTMRALYDEIVKLKLIGKSAKSELDLIEKYNEEKDIDELIDIVQNKKDAKLIKKGYINGFGNLESTVNAIFNKDIKERYATEVLYAETNSQAWQYKVKTEFENAVAKIYNLPKWNWDFRILQYLKEKHTYQEYRRKYDPQGECIKTRIIDRTLTKMDIIQAYIWSKNEVLEKRLINQFGEDGLNTMFDELSLQDVKLAELMMHTAQSFYPMVNKAFIQKYGLDLPKVSCYFPSTPERGSEVDLYNDYSSKSLGNGFTKARAQSELLPMDFHNPVATLYSHIDGVAKFCFMSDSLDKMNLRFRNNDLKRAIINKFGEDVYRTLEQNLINVTYKKESAVFNGVSKVLDNMIGNWIGGNVMIKPIVGLKQLLSATNYAVDMPYLEWQKGFLKALAHPKETIDYVMQIPYIKARYGGNMSNEFMKSTIENSAFAASKKLKDLCSIFIKTGDIGAIIFGGKPYIDYLINKKGLSEQEAIKQFIISTNRSQQSSAVSSLSNFQVNMTRNPIGKLVIAFKNSPQQYVRMCGDAIISCANGDISKTQCAKALFNFAYLQPFLYTIMTTGSIFRFIFGGDPDDLKKDAFSSIFDLNAGALPFFGDIYKYTITRLGYKEKGMPDTMPLFGDIEKEINRISKEDADAKDYLEAVGYLGGHVGLGYNVKALWNMGSGVGDIFTGYPVQGAMKLTGYTEKRAKSITDDE
ncbi:MAG: hypothetical protein SPL73_05740 [Cyanobacteriota bacterium]|nr:hypothetical protein [Cyanobacteriota bacterium]MDY6364373.1 hypothetical protein [Cyanobacteriota bacterium]